MPKEENLTGDQVVALTKKYLSPEDVAFVQKALVYAVDCHNGQFRQSGEPYIIHPIQVAGILAKLKLDAVTVACGFLHDVVEDTSPMKSSWRKTIARCSWPCLKISVSFWSNWQTACIICVPSSICARISKNAFRVRPWRSMHR